MSMSHGDATACSHRCNHKTAAAAYHSPGHGPPSAAQLSRLRRMQIQVQVQIQAQAQAQVWNHPTPRGERVGIAAPQPHHGQ